MTTPDEPRREHPSTYFVQDRSNEEELSRLRVQDQMITAGTPQLQAFYEDAQQLFRNTRPFIQKWGCISQDYNAICQQALKELQESDFHTIWNFLTVWGKRP